MVRSRVRAVLALLVVVLAVVVMVRLSLWQWDKARAHGRFLNYTYAAEWLAFAALTLAGVVRLAIEGRRAAGEAARPARAEPAEHRVAPAGAPVPMVGPPLAPGEELEELTWVRLRRRLGLEAVARRRG